GRWAFGGRSMSEEESRRALIRQRRSYRRQWIAKFAQLQRNTKRWIACADLIEWCAQSTTTSSNHEQIEAREVAYRCLAESIHRGEFEQNGRSKVLYLDAMVTTHAPSPSCRLTRAQFERVLEVSAERIVLNCCWLQNDMA